MNLKDFLANRDKPPELYWSLVLEEGWVQAGIWYINGKAAEVISTSPATPWETEAELVGASDAALSSAVQKLAEDHEEPNKTVFGVPNSWVLDGTIVKEKLGLIKKLCTDLSLTPVGFVVIPEAIAHLYKSEEGSPVNAIVLGLAKDSLEISVFKLGSLVGSTTVSRSVSLVEDVTEGLSRFEGASPLPSRFIVFDGKGIELEEAKEALVKHRWEDGSIKFLHTPKAEIVLSERKVLATSLAGANEIGGVVEVSSSEAVSVSEDPVPTDLENVSESDIINPEELGFSVGKDVSDKLSTKQTAEMPSFSDKNVQKPVGKYLNKTKELLHIFTQKVISGTKPRIVARGSGRSFTNLGLVGITVLLLGIVFWWYYPKAEITIYVTPKSFQQDFAVTLSTNGETDVAAGVLPAVKLTETVVGEKTTNVTGSKTVGDKAKGTVQIQNGTAFPINLAGGAILVSTGNLKFSLDKEASVSAALSPTSPGTATVSVTAEVIGAEYNLAKGEVFRVGNYPKAEVDATSQTDFSGGSSRVISAVSSDDSDRLSDQLKEELKQLALDKISSQVSSDRVFIDELVSLEITSEDFDRKVGDEAENLKLALALEAVGLTVDRQNLFEYAKQVLNDKVPQGFVLRDSQISFDFVFEGQEDGRFAYKLAVGANFLPQTDLENIKRQIAGKTTEAAQTYLTQVPGFTRAAVTLKPKFPGPFGLIPQVKKNVTLEIVAEK